MKKLLLATILTTLSGVSFATVNPGWYLGLQLGKASTDYSASNISINNPNGFFGVTPTGSDNDVGVGRLMLGYQFNPYIAAELGYTDFGQMQFKNVLGVNQADIQLDQTAVDLLAKVIMPLPMQFNLFAIGGEARVSLDYTENTAAKNLGIKGNASHAWRPVYGLGAGYDFNQKLSFDLSWRRIQHGGSVEDSDLTMAGIAYHVA